MRKRSVADKSQKSGSVREQTGHGSRPQLQTAFQASPARREMRWEGRRSGSRSPASQSQAENYLRKAASSVTKCSTYSYCSCHHATDIFKLKPPILRHIHGSRRELASAYNSALDQRECTCPCTHREPWSELLGPRSITDLSLAALSG